MNSTGDLRVLVIGKGAREHALAWKLSQSESVEHIYVAPGNGGTAQGLHKVSNLEAVDVDQFDELVALAKKYKIGLVVVGPDSAIVGGIEEHFRRANIPCFAPSKAAAELEGSKAFAKEFLKRNQIPTAEYRAFDTTTYQQAREYVLSVSHRVVIKADGLAAGKGVILPETAEDALQALEDILVKRHFGSAGESVIIEEFLEGQEISVSTLSDGTTSITLPIGQDHKRIGDGDQGLNTGGMGVLAPVPFVTSKVQTQIEESIIKPTFEALHGEGRPFRGLLFTGIMLTKSGPKVLEYNARFGDPEAQSILPLLSPDVDLAQVLLACVQGGLHEIKIDTVPCLVCCGVVITAHGYPGPYRQGDNVSLYELPKDYILFHAGTRIVDDKLVTAGGRVLTVVGMGASPSEAIAAAYNGVRSVNFNGKYYRRDIGQKALAGDADLLCAEQVTS